MDAIEDHQKVINQMMQMYEETLSQKEKET
jgi:hypothetical protein